MRTVHRTLDAVVLAVTVPLMVLMLGCVVWQVVARYALNVSTSMTDEIARFTFIWVSLLGAAYVLGRSHLFFARDDVDDGDGHTGFGVVWIAWFD